MNKQNKPSYYAVIPSHVRYCEMLGYPERLLYGEITALTGKDGYCFASNKYFAELYHVTIQTISKWISNLNKYGFIKVEIIRSEKKEVLERRIFIVDNSNRNITSDTYTLNNEYPSYSNSRYPYYLDNEHSINRNFKYNNIKNKIDELFNYIINNKEKIPEKMTLAQINELKELLQRLELNYTEEIINIFTKDNIEKIKIVIFTLKELLIKNKKNILMKITRDKLIWLYDNCKEKEILYKGTEKEINNFLDYYYISCIREFKKAL